MYEILDKINSPADLKTLSTNELILLCDEIRSFLVENVTKTGGHLASNLGVVELTVALNIVYDFPCDKIVWDVGHQSYVHKILTGRRDRFNTLRKFGGLSGFPKCSESEYDCFNTGHSSTSASAAIGMARARDINQEKHNICAVFGDGAMTGGMIYEAIDDVGHKTTPIVFVLNDNQMSISKNVGSLSKYLRHLRQTPEYHTSKKRVSEFINSIPRIGKPIYNAIKRIKLAIKSNVLPDTFFDDMGLEYLGPVDGHNISDLISVLNLAKNMQKPVIVHITTKKGKGHIPAEKSPQDFHGISPLSSKPTTQTKYKDYSECAGKTLISLAQKNKKLTAVTAAMPQGVSLVEFAKKFPDRFFDVGIAEEHAVTLCAGMAKGGLVPVFAVYSSFLQRAYDQILHDVCLQKLHVVFLIDRAGVVGADGETHHGLYDISFMKNMPEMTVLSPSSFDEFIQMIDYAVNIHTSPICIRYPRGCESFDEIIDFNIRGFNCLGNDNQNFIIATGRMANVANMAKKDLEKEGITTTLITLSVISPLPEKLISVLEGAKKIITIEDHQLIGGMSQSIADLIAKNNINPEFKILAFPNEPIVHGEVWELDKKYNLTKESIYNYFKN